MSFCSGLADHLVYFCGHLAFSLGADWKDGSAECWHTAGVVGDGPMAGPREEVRCPAVHSRV
jgi:hypothetical protein